MTGEISEQPSEQPDYEIQANEQEDPNILGKVDHLVGAIELRLQEFVKGAVTRVNERIYPPSKYYVVYRNGKPHRIPKTGVVYIRSAEGDRPLLSEKLQQGLRDGSALKPLFEEPEETESDS